MSSKDKKESKAKSGKSSNSMEPYIKGCAKLQIAVWRITHRDPLNAFDDVIFMRVWRRVVLLLMEIRERNRLNKLRESLHKWLRLIKNSKDLDDKRRALLKLLIARKNAKLMQLLGKKFQKWKNLLSFSEEEILRKYGAFFKLIDLLVKRAMRPHKEEFIQKIKHYVNPENYKKPLRNCYGIYSKAQLGILRRAFNIWRDNVKLMNLNEMKRRVLRTAIKLTIIAEDRQRLLKALNNWRNKCQEAKLKSNRNALKARLAFTLYSKYKNRADKIGLTRGLLKWKANSRKDDSFKNKILDAKKHMLKHNINKNAEDLLNRLKSIYDKKHRSDLLRRRVDSRSKIEDLIKRKYLQRWLDKAKKLSNLELLKKTRLRLVTFLMDNKNKKTIGDILRKTLYKWYKNTASPNTALPNTQKAVELLRKAGTEPFFDKLKKKMQEDIKKDRLRGLLASYFRKNDKDLLHWWFCQWRSNSHRLRNNDYKAFILNMVMNNKEKENKLKTIRNLKEKVQEIKHKEDLQKRILTNLINKYNKILQENKKGKLQRALYKWKANCGDFKNPFETTKPYEDGARILQRFCWRTTHQDVLNAFSEKIMGPARSKLLRKIIDHNNKTNRNNALRNALRRWRNNTRDRGQLKKLRRMFDDYLMTLRSELMEPYKYPVEAMKKWADKKSNAAKSISDYLRGIKELPDQIRHMKINTKLLSLINKYEPIHNKKVKSSLADWNRRARVIKQENQSQIIQKWLREKLRKRKNFRDMLEEGIEHTKRHIWQKVFERILDTANRNRIPEILRKYIEKKEAIRIKTLKDKFHRWRDLIPYLQKEDAATYIQSIFRGYLIRRDMGKKKELYRLLKKIMEKLLEKSRIDPAFFKWRKNARLVKALENDKIIQDFCRRMYAKRMKTKALEALQKLFKDYIWKQITDMMNRAGKFNPDDVETLCRTIKVVTCREPYHKLLNGLRWIAIMNKMRKFPSLWDKINKNRKEKALFKWYVNGYLIPNAKAQKIQETWRSYNNRKKLSLEQRLKEILKKLLTKLCQSDEELQNTAFRKWIKNTRLIKCEEQSKIIQDFCRKVREKYLLKIREKYQRLAIQIMPHQINQTAKFNYANVLLNKLLKKKIHG